MVVEAIDLDVLTLDSFRGRPVAVLGLARSGIALCRFLADRGAVVTGYDARTAGELWRQANISTLDQLEAAAAAGTLRELKGMTARTEQRLLAALLFRLFDIERIEASTDVENIAEQRSLEKAGFTREGILRRAQWRAGAHHDLVSYSILREGL